MYALQTYQYSSLVIQIDVFTAQRRSVKTFFANRIVGGKLNIAQSDSGPIWWERKSDPHSILVNFSE
ncbi:hypothetical protein CCGE531_30230 (plasmid) [Rhizobium sp. CCGE531]|nr:hypothetical protein CCGE531_30230 [Rhizobium sp. CCGE531]AYG76742.1 hypothetical protein CCGE532_29855 [Rhizobium sp. CCGE532]TGE87596.1 hypothetical protein C9417_31540 [Rhizobium sp. SEMIA 4088]